MSYRNFGHGSQTFVADCHRRAFSPSADSAPALLLPLDYQGLTLGILREVIPRKVAKKAPWQTRAVQWFVAVGAWVVWWMLVIRAQFRQRPQSRYRLENAERRS
jgi:hypothetical protein